MNCFLINRCFLGFLFIGLDWFIEHKGSIQIRIETALDLHLANMVQVKAYQLIGAVVTVEGIPTIHIVDALPASLNVDGGLCQCSESRIEGLPSSKLSPLDDVYFLGHVKRANP
jgi:hypothetical protein